MMLDFYNCSINDLLIKRKSLKRKLAETAGLHEIRIAVLGGTTTDEIVNMSELLLLSDGYLPTYYQSEYGRYYEEAVHEPRAMIEFRPHLVYVHTSFLNIRNLPPLNCTEDRLPALVEAELSRFIEIWDEIEANIGCQVVQNNFELPPHALLGNLDASSAGAQSRFVMELNLSFARRSVSVPKFSYRT